jgi:hypothetical protein
MTVGWPDGTDHMTFGQVMVGPSRRDAVPRSTAVEDLWAGMAALERPDDPIVMPAPSQSSFGGGGSTTPWPKLDPDALHGPVGAFVRAAAPHTEADPAGLLVSTLVLLGGAIGGAPYVLAGNERHGAALFAVLVGATSKGRKGTAMAAAAAVDRDHIVQALIAEVGYPFDCHLASAQVPDQHRWLPGVGRRVREWQ